MRDGFTRQVQVGERDSGFVEWLARWQATVVVLSGDEAGHERELDRPSVVIGRGPEDGWTFADETMSKEHACLEFTGGGIRLRDLGSRNGTRVNGAGVAAADLKHGDRFELGSHEFQLVLEKRLGRRPPLAGAPS